MDEPTRKSDMDRFNAPRKLHYITIASFLFGLAFCLPHGIVTGEVAPALGLIPLGIGASLALYRGNFSTHKKNRGNEYQILLTDDEEHNKAKLTLESVLLAILDFGCFGGLVITVVFSILANNEPNCRYHYRGSVYNGIHYSNSWATCRSMQPMLAAWATMVMIANALIHLYLLLRFVPKLWHGRKRQSEASVCSRCRAPICEEGRSSPKQTEHDDNPSSSIVSAA